METQLLLFLFVIEQFLFLCGFLSFVSHESTAGTTILTLFLAETLFCKHSLKVKRESRFSFSDNEKSTICFFFLLSKIAKTHSQVLLNANAPLTSPYISVFLGTFQELLFLYISSHFSYANWESLSSQSSEINEKPFGCIVHHMGSLALGYWVFVIPSRIGSIWFCWSIGIEKTKDSVGISLWL